MHEHSYLDDRRCGICAHCVIDPFLYKNQKSSGSLLRPIDERIFLRCRAIQFGRCERALSFRQVAEQNTTPQPCIQRTCRVDGRFALGPPISDTAIGHSQIAELAPDIFCSYGAEVLAEAWVAEVGERVWRDDNSLNHSSRSSVGKSFVISSLVAIIALSKCFATLSGFSSAVFCIPVASVSSFAMSSAKFCFGSFISPFAYQSLKATTSEDTGGTEVAAEKFRMIPYTVPKVTHCTRIRQQCCILGLQ